MSSGIVNLSSGTHTIELRGLNPNGGDNTAFVDAFTYTRVGIKQLSSFEAPVVISGTGFEYQPTGGPWTFTPGAGLSKNNSGFTNGNPQPLMGSKSFFCKEDQMPPSP